jgi:hypothetical protein
MNGVWVPAGVGEHAAQKDWRPKRVNIHTYHSLFHISYDSSSMREFPVKRVLDLPDFPAPATSPEAQLTFPSTAY